MAGQREKMLTVKESTLLPISGQGWRGAKKTASTEMRGEYELPSIYIDLHGS